MKSIKNLLMIMMVLIPLYSMGQTRKPVAKTYRVSTHEKRVEYLLESIDSLIMINHELLKDLETKHSFKNRYELYQTENIYTFLELDTQTGKINQVQWHHETDKEGTLIINDDDLSYGIGFGSGSFELYPTKNMYTFILLDKIDGRKWHVQWGTGGDKSRWIRRIY